MVDGLGGAHLLLDLSGPLGRPMLALRFGSRGKRCSGAKSLGSPKAGAGSCGELLDWLGRWCEGWKVWCKVWWR